MRTVQNQFTKAAVKNWANYQQFPCNSLSTAILETEVILHLHQDL